MHCHLSWVLFSQISFSVLKFYHNHSKLSRTIVNFKKTRSYTGPHNYQGESSIFYFTFNPDEMTTFWQSGPGNSQTIDGRSVCSWLGSNREYPTNCCLPQQNLIDDLEWVNSDGITNWLDGHGSNSDPNSFTGTPLCFYGKIRTIAYLSSVFFNIGLGLKAILFLRYYRWVEQSVFSSTSDNNRFSVCRRRLDHS